MRFRAGAERADFRAPARSPTPARRPRFPPVATEDPDVDAFANGGWHKAAARTSASPRTARAGHHPDAPALLPDRRVAGVDQRSAPRDERATADRIRPRPPDRRDCIGHVAAMPRRYAA